MSLKENVNNISITTGTILRFFLVIIGFVLLYLLTDTILILLTAVVIASFVQIAANKMARYRFHRTLSVVLIYFISCGIIAILFYLFTPILLNETIDFANSISHYFPDNNFLNNFQDDTFSDAKEIVVDISRNNTLPSIVENIKSFASSFSGSLIDFLASAFGGIMNLVLIFVISFYLSIEEKGIENFLRIILPIKYEDYAVDLWNRSQRKIALWVRGQLLLGLLVGVLVYLGLLILGVRYALLLAITAAIFELIPFGFVLSAIPAVVFAYIHGSVGLSFMTFSFYVIIHQFESYLLQPLIIKKTVGISPLVVILSLLVGFKLASFWGVMLAVPIAVVFIEFFDDLEKEKTILKSNDEK